MAVEGMSNLKIFRANFVYDFHSCAHADNKQSVQPILLQEACKWLLYLIVSTLHLFKYQEKCLIFVFQEVGTPYLL